MITGDLVIRSNHYTSLVADFTPPDMVMLVLGGVRDPKGPHDYTAVTCIWFEAGARHQAAYPVADVEITTAKPSAELSDYIAEQEAETSKRMMRSRQWL